PAVLNLGASGTSVAQDDVILLRRNVPGLAGSASYAAPGENSTSSAGTQALRLIQGSATADWNYYMDSEWRDGDTAALKEMVVQGNWRVRLWARGVNNGDQLRVRFFRENQADFINQTFTLTTSWAQYTATANIAAGVDDITPPAVGQYRPILGF